MQFSEDTLKVLKNFATINPSIMFKPGNTVRTISPQKTVMAAATVSENFTVPAGVFDLNRFLATLSVSGTSGNVDFGVDRFRVTNGPYSADYTYAAETMIVTPPDRDIPIPAADAVVSVKWDVMKTIINAAGVLNLSEIAFTGDGEKISISAIDSKNVTGDSYSAVLSEAKTEKFQKIIKAENLKLLPYDYDVTISTGIAHFKSPTVQYWVAVESK